MVFIFCLYLSLCLSLLFSPSWSLFLCLFSGVCSVVCFPCVLFFPIIYLLLLSFVFLLFLCLFRSRRCVVSHGRASISNTTGTSARVTSMETSQHSHASHNKDSNTAPRQERDTTRHATGRASRPRRIRVRTPLQSFVFDILRKAKR